ncbi:MAG: MBL fold metallo-hydrolase [Candidatus Zixiibacteriota bacterium]
MSYSTFTFLGTSSGVPQAGRASSGHMLKVEDSLSLIDCGGGVCSSFLKCGFDPLKVDRIFISHTHPDHVCELPLFLQMIYLAGRREPVTCYLPDEFVAPFDAYLPSVYIIKERLSFPLTITGYGEGVVYNELFHLEAIANSHLMKYAEHVQRLSLPNKMQCHSFDIRVSDRRLFYSSDLASFDEIKDCLFGCDVAVVEATHIDLEQLLSFLPTAHVGRMLLTHVMSEEQAQLIEAQARDARIDNLVVAIDGLTVKL